MRDEIDRFRKSDVQPFGVNPAGVEAHGRYAAKLKLPFPLLSDADRQVTGAFGALKADGVKTQRSVVLIDIDRLQREAERREGEVRFYRDCLRDKPHFTVVYEAFFGSDHEGRERALRTLCQFLSVRYEDLDMRNLQHWIFMPDRKQTPDEVLRRIPNYDDLREFL